jgi:uncharacterized protein
MTADKKSFLGRGWRFPPAFDLFEGAVEMVTGERDIIESLYILMTTIPGERLMRPEYGCALQQHVFEDIDTTTATYLERIIADAILYFEPRIAVNQISIDDLDASEGMRRITIDYTIRQTNTRSNIVIPFFWQEGTDVQPLT